MVEIMTMSKKSRVFLSPVLQNLPGSFPADAEEVIVVCDTTLGAFTIELPIPYNNESRRFTLYNISKYGVGGTITVTARSINYVLGATKTVAVNEVVSFVDSLDGTWLVSGA